VSVSKEASLLCVSCLVLKRFAYLREAATLICTAGGNVELTELHDTYLLFL
jgi:hypothetical protein